MRDTVALELSADRGGRALAALARVLEQARSRTQERAVNALSRIGGVAAAISLRELGRLDALDLLLRRVDRVRTPAA